tara:strand:+ start:548 stop:700 length:153 start_codon:yes stop_codon:yes gene_type:complete
MLTLQGQALTRVRLDHNPLHLLTVQEVVLELVMVDLDQVRQEQVDQELQL